MVVDQQSLLEDKDRLEELRRSYDGEARLNESFIVLTVDASLGLVAENNAVIIGAMVVAPWILPLRVAVFAILIGQARLLSRSLIPLSFRRSRDHLDPVDGIGPNRTQSGLACGRGLARTDHRPA